MIQHILAPVDRSAHADHAVELAGDLTNRYGAKPTLLHVTPDIHWSTVPRELLELANAKHLRQASSSRVCRIGCRARPRSAQDGMARAVHHRSAAAAPIEAPDDRQS